MYVWGLQLDDSFSLKITAQALEITQAAVCVRKRMSCTCNVILLRKPDARVNVHINNLHQNGTSVMLKPRHRDEQEVLQVA